MPHFSRQQIAKILERAMQLNDAEAEELIRASVNDSPGLVDEMLDRLRMLVDTQPLNDMAERLDRHGGLPYTELGPWRLLRVLDQGGSSTICEAEREDGFQQRVAIKILDRIGPAEVSAVRRFIAERQFLADLDHPNIAHLIDGGTAPRGEPYLVLELVTGRPLDEYCLAENLDLKAILKLVAVVARTVHFAHQRLLIHRDLKPRNILVTGDGQPKLLDFGAAKQRSVMADTTRRSRAPMTVLYASPEQVSSGFLSTATDIYSLGVVLYQLITTRSPYSVSLEEPYALTRAIVESTPPAPSRERKVALSDGLSLVDLDAVVLKALAKKPKDRYASMAAFADDLEALAALQPVSARVASAWDRSLRFLRSHRLAASIAAVSLAALLALTLVLLLALERTKVAQSGSEESLALLFEVLGSANDGRATTPLDARELLLKARSQVDQRFASSVLDRMQLHGRIGSALASLGFHAEALPAIADARRLAESTNRAEWSAFAYAEAVSRFANGDYGGTLISCAELLNPPAELPAPSKVQRLRAEMLRAMADLSEDQLRAPQSVASAREAASGLLVGESSPAERIDVLTRLGEIEMRAGEILAASVNFGRALDLSTKTLASSAPESAALRLQLMRVARMQGEFGRAQELGQDALSAQIAIYGANSPKLIILYADIGIAALSVGDLDAAERANQRALALIDAVAPDRMQPFAPGVLSALARVAMERGRATQAIDLAQQSVQLALTLFKPTSFDVAASELVLATIQFELGPTSASRDLANRVQLALETTLGADHVMSTRAQELNGRIELANGAKDRAAALFESALRGRQAAYGQSHPQVVLLRVRVAIARGELPLQAELAQAWQRASSNADALPARTIAEIKQALADQPTKP